jgi:hypothetical protein
MSDVDDMRKYIIIAPVVVKDLPDAHNVFLQVTNQRFCVTPFAYDKDEADWMADQLCVALGAIVRAAVEAEREACAKVCDRLCEIQAQRTAFATVIRARKP